MGFFSFVSDDDIDRLRQHKFSSAGYTALDNLLDPFWLALARQVPRRISPNMISVVGGACATAASVSSVVATRFESPALYFLAPLLIFIYMNADAMDGKHARMTSQSTPLGALVDHGIDAFIAFTTGVSVCITVESSLSTTLIMWGYVLFQSSWFCAQWGELELGSLDQRGITEGEFATMFILSLPGLVSLDIMSWSVPSLPIVGVLQLRTVINYGVIVACGAVTVAFALKIVMAASGRRLSACLPFLHMCLHDIVSVLLSKTSLYQQSSLLVFIVVGMNAAMLMTKMRLAATLHCSWPLVHYEMLPFFSLAAVHISGVEFHVGVFFLLLAWQCLAFALLWHDTVTRICRLLDIPFLREVPLKQQ